MSESKTLTICYESDELNKQFFFIFGKVLSSFYVSTNSEITHVLLFKRHSCSITRGFLAKNYFLLLFSPTSTFQ